MPFRHSPVLLAYFQYKILHTQKLLICYIIVKFTLGGAHHLKILQKYISKEKPFQMLLNLRL